MNCLQDNYLYQEVNFNTRYREGQQLSLLDLIIVNNDQMVDDVNEASPFGKKATILLSSSTYDATQITMMRNQKDTSMLKMTTMV